MIGLERPAARDFAFEFAEYAIEALFWNLQVELGMRFFHALARSYVSSDRDTHHTAVSCRSNAV